MIIDAASMICEKKKELKFKAFSEEWIKLCSSENIHMGVKGVLNHRKIQYISKITRRDYYLQNNVQYMNIKENPVGFNNNI